MAKPPDRVDTAIWQTAAASRVLLDSVPGVVSLLSSWATDVLQMPLKLEAYGSVVTGIADTSSDIDVVLQSDSLEDAASILARLYDAHERLPHFHVVRFLESARAPVLTVARADGLMVDITAGSCLPVYNSRLLKEYCELDHRLLPLACAIKRFAKVAGVVGAATHNLSSYAWSLMVVFYLQAANLKCYLPSSVRSSNLPSLQSACRSCEVTIQGRKFDVGFKRLTDFPPPDAGRAHGSESLSSFPWRSLALGFFKFFLEDFDLDKEIISVCCGSRQFVDASTTGPGPHIRDPFDPGRDLGGVLSAPRREAFREALMVGRRLLEEKVAFAGLLQGDADLCSPVQWDTLVHSEELQHHRVQPGGHAPRAAQNKSGDLDFGSTELDDFQKRSMHAIAQKESVVVAAPTSAGKTAVAEYAMMVALRNHGSVMFCSPTKALSNQKFIDFHANANFSRRVGLLTGDSSVAPVRRYWLPPRKFCSSVCTLC